MNGQDMFLGMNYVDAKLVEEAETVTQLKCRNQYMPLRRLVLIASIIAVMLFLMGSAIVSMVKMRVSNISRVVENKPTLIGEAMESDDTLASESEEYQEIIVGEAVHFEEVHDVYIELGAYYPQEIPEGYTMSFVSEGAPLQNQHISYENTDRLYIDYWIFIGDSASNVEIYDIVSKTDVEINGQDGILYEQVGGHRALVWINEDQGYGFALRTDDTTIDLIAMAKSTAEGETLVPTRTGSTIKAVEELGDYYPTYLPEGYVEQGTMGSPLEEGGGWYSYVRKWFVNKEENNQIYFECETYQISTEDGYTDDAKTICSFFIPGCNILNDEIVGEEVEINGMFGLAIGNHIAWADPEAHVVYHIYSEDVIGEELLKVAQSVFKVE